MIVRQPWRPGPEEAAPGPVLVSATRFDYRGRRYIPLVGYFAWRLRRAWGRRPGAVGLVVGGEALGPTTYSLSVWRAKDDLQRFLRSPEHARLVRDFRDRLDASTAVTWETHERDPRALWNEGLRRLAERQAVISPPVTARISPDT